MKTSTLAPRIATSFRIALALLLAPLSVGCSQGRTIGVQVESARALALATQPKEVDQVEVWLDEAPRGEFVVVGELEARGVESPVSIARMQKRAAELGFDGIYWIDCTGACSGDCKAKAFMYTGGGKLDGRHVASR